MKVGLSPANTAYDTKQDRLLRTVQENVVITHGDSKGHGDLEKPRALEIYTHSKNKIHPLISVIKRYNLHLKRTACCYKNDQSLRAV